MKWQQIVPLAIILVAVVIFVWRSAGKKTGGCGCKCGCPHGPDSEAGKEDAAH